MRFDQRVLIALSLGLVLVSGIYWGEGVLRKSLNPFSFFNPTHSPLSSHSSPDGESNGFLSILAQQGEWLNVSRPLEAQDLRNRIILLDFWTYCCINCMHILPELHQLEKEFGSSLLVIGVHSGKFDQEKSTEAIRSAVLRHSVEHPVINDSHFKVWERFNVRAWPTLILIHPAGGVERVYSGEGHFKDLRSKILALTQKFSGSLNQSPLPIALEKNQQPHTLLRFPGKLTYDPDRKWIWISDSQNARLLGVDLSGRIREVIHSALNEGGFNQPQGLVYQNHKLYVADTGNHQIKRVDVRTRQIELLAGSGLQGGALSGGSTNALKTALSSPWDLAFFPGQPHLLVIAMAGVHQLWGLDLKKSTVGVIAGNGIESMDDGGFPYHSLSQPSGLSTFRGKTYFVDSETSSLRVLENSQVVTLLGKGLFDFGLKDGPLNQARMQHPLGVWADAQGVWIADTFNHAIRLYDPIRKHLRTLSGGSQAGLKDGSFDEARFNEPSGLMRVGHQVFVTDTNNHRIRILDLERRQVRTLELQGAERGPERASQLGSHSGGVSGSDLNSQPLDFKKRHPRALHSSLPRLLYRGVIELSESLPQSVALEFKRGWKLNDRAPSWMAVFESEDGQVFRQIREYSREDLRTPLLKMPAVSGSKKYRLQGTLYTCKKGQESVCTLQSVDYELLPRVQRDQSKITILLDQD